MDIDARTMDAEIRSAKARLYIMEAMMSAVFCRLAELESIKVAESAPAEPPTAAPPLQEDSWIGRDRLS